ncbi:glutamate racemase [Nitrososphaera sp.]|uniref:glutamate racemase n=1 Tax=Nitrososphaera sp. TaxID=1971748 RepID=UPI001817D222|nr:glutamate racemase [Nitrososphaera sp.]NWG36437.1 glutamate racemase [Nitrososphaera sp.]
MTNNPIAVFDSGIGSLSIIKELRRELPAEDLLYFADRAHFPYGNMSHKELYEIVFNTINYLKRFKPKLIVLASNTPSVQVLEEVKKRVTDVPVIGVRPPLKEAARMTKKKHIGILATAGTVNSKELEAQIRKEVPQHILVTKFNASPIVQLVEQGVHLTDERRTFDVISRVLGDDADEKIDVITLSSTHLPFVKRYLNALLPTVRFVDPAQMVAKDVRKFLKFYRMTKKSGSGKLQILVSDGKREFEKSVRAMGVREPVEEVFLTF